MISYKLFPHSEPVGPMIRETFGLLYMIDPPFDIEDVTWRPLCFQNKVKLILRQAFLAIDIL